MRKFKYQKNTGKITFLDTLEIITLNPMANFIFNQLSEGLSDNLIAQNITNEYHVSINDSLVDINNFKNELHEQGILFKQPSKTNCISLTTAICHIIQNCNSKCAMCDCWKIKKTNFIKHKYLYPFFEHLKTIGCKEIMISGGEPLLHPELERILDDIKKLGFRQILNTNALLLDQCKWIAQSDIHEVVISLDDTANYSYKALRGVDGYEKICLNIKNLKQKSPNTLIKTRTTINKYNYNKIHHLLEFARQHNLSGVGFSPADLSSTSFSRYSMNKQREGQLKEQMLPTLPDLELFIKEFTPDHFQYKFLDQMASINMSQWDGHQFLQCLKYYQQILSGKQLFFENKPCVFPDVALVLDYDGALKHCFYSESFGNIHDFDSIDWNSSKSLQKLISHSTCSTCRGKIFCDMETI